MVFGVLVGVREAALERREGVGVRGRFEERKRGVGLRWEENRDRRGILRFFFERWIFGVWFFEASFFVEAVVIFERGWRDWGKIIGRERAKSGVKSESEGD